MVRSVTVRLKAAPALASPLEGRCRLADGAKMVSWTRTFGLILLSGGTLMNAPASELIAATSATLDILSDDRNAQPADSVDVGNLKPRARPYREASKPPPSGNPLWSVPLSLLTATRERPIFLATRRPPRPAVVAAPVVQAPPAPPKAVEPERLTLALIGAVVSDDDAIAVFVDRTNQKIVRLRQGETHAGWVLSSVLKREVTLNKADRTEVLILQRPDGSPGAPGMPGRVIPAAGGVDASYAPFVPRSTPKNGAPDGL
jgi:general secretion pathway protein N